MTTNDYLNLFNRLIYSGNQSFPFYPPSTNISANIGTRTDLYDLLPYHPYEGLFPSLFQDQPDQRGLRPGDCLNSKQQKVPCGSAEDIGEVITEGELALAKENEELKAKLDEEGFLGIPGALKKVGDLLAGAGLLIGGIGVLILIVLILKR